MSLIERLNAASFGTWPAGREVQVGGLTLRLSEGGGKRVNSAYVTGPVSDEDITKAEAQFAAHGTAPLFQLGEGDGDLDAMLDARGYTEVERTNLMHGPIDVVAAPDHDRELASLAVWEPLAIQREFWEQGGIDASRIAVMDRVTGPKTALIGRSENSPGGTCFVAVHDGVAMLHALEVIPKARRGGVGRAMTIQAARWARDEGATDFALLVTERNTAARALYEGLGMVRLGGYHYRQKGN